MPNTTSTANVSICDGSSYLLPDGVSQSTTGTYVSVIPNAAGCDSTITTNLTVNSTLVFTATAVQIACNGGTGSVILNTSGGQFPYTYGPQSTTGLLQGVYNFSVTDAIGCMSNATATINAEPSPLSLQAVANQIMCYSGLGSVMLTASGGSPSYAYSGSATTNLVAGSYNYTVSDSRGCMAIASAIINAAPSILNGTVSTTTTLCIANTGTATVTVSGGTPPYSYSWNTSPLQTTSIAANLGAGFYVATITDNNGCIKSVNATINSLTPPVSSITGTLSYCPGGSTNLCAPGGLASYLWSTGATTQCILVSSAGTYSVVVTNSSGCSNSSSVNVVVSAVPTCTISGAGFICPGGAVMIGAPTGYPYYLWSNGARTPFITVKVGGTYTVTVRNAAGCSVSCSKTIIAPLKVTVVRTNGSCSNSFLGSASAVVTGGTPPFTYRWNNERTTSSISDLTSATYAVTVTDANGCKATATGYVSVVKSAADYSKISSNFNNTDIPAGRHIWFSSMVKVNYNGTYPLVIKFTDQRINSSKFNLYPKNGKLIISDTYTSSSTVFTGTEWITTAPPNLSGLYFVSGFSHPVNVLIYRNLNSVYWQGIWASSSCVNSIEWKWAAATYSNFTFNVGLLGVKSVDDSTYANFQNNNPAGTPENYKAFCVQGARSNGPNDYIGQYAGVATRIPCAPSSGCISSPPPGSRLADTSVDNETSIQAKAYPNPFSSLTTIEFSRSDKSCHAKVEVYALTGRKVATLFDDEMEKGQSYLVKLEASDLPEDVYIYKIITDDNTINGKLILMK